MRWKAPVKGHFKGEERCFSGVEFIGRVTEHIPPPRLQLVRRFGLYSSRGRGTWKARPALKSRAPAHWYGRAGEGSQSDHAEPGEMVSADSQARKKAWARLLKKVYEVDIWSCPDCGGRMEVIALILDPQSIRKIIACLEGKARSPP